MMAAPLSIVSIRVSWPGASTNETARRNFASPPQMRALRVHPVARGRRTVRALVERRVGVAELDGDAALELLGVPVGPLPRQRLREGGLPVVYVADETDVDLGLTGNLHDAARSSARGLGPFCSTTRLIWTVSSLIVFPRNVRRFRIPRRGASNPNPSPT